MSNDDSLERTYNDRLRERLEDMNTPTPEENSIQSFENWFNSCGWEKTNINFYNSGMFVIEQAKRARQLEQELSEVKDALDEVLDEIIDNADGAPDATGVGAFCTGLIRQHNALMMGDRLSARQERDQLRKVVDSVCDETQSMINYCNGDIMYSVTDIRFLKARCLENIKRIEQLPHVIEQRKSK